MNIFQKNCPECATLNPVEAASCRCGYCFDPEALAETDADAYAQQQERLYGEYLAARLVQAEAELTAARERMKADPHDTRQAAAASAAVQALNALQAELKRVSPRASAGSATALPQKPGVMPTATPRPAGTARGGAPEPSAGSAKNKQHPHPHGTAAPSESFRRLQAEKAETIARSNAPGGQPGPISKPFAKSPAAPRPTAAGAETTRACPHCTANVPIDLARCRCGYVFSRAQKEVPALSLDADGLAVLAKGRSLPKPPPRR